MRYLGESTTVEPSEDNRFVEIKTKIIGLETTGSNEDLVSYVFRTYPWKGEGKIDSSESAVRDFGSPKEYITIVELNGAFYASQRGPVIRDNSSKSLVEALVKHNRDICILRDKGPKELLEHYIPNPNF